MDSKIPTSFIPKDTIRTDLRTKREPVSILSIISLIILTGSLVYLAGLYTYRYTVYNEINAPCTSKDSSGSCGLVESLNIETREFQQDKLDSLTRLDTKLNQGSSVLDGHVSVSPLFRLLGEITNQNIQYQKFEFNKNVVTISGIAKSYEDIAFQQKVFSTDQKAKDNISNFSLSDFDLDAKGQVSFKLTLVVNQKLLSYRQNSSSQ